ncbi:MAG: hypothetical protein ABI763_15260 [Bacteroidota bacterium]
MLESKSDRFEKKPPVNGQVQRSTINNVDIQNEENISQENSTLEDDETNQKRRFGHNEFNATADRGTNNGRESAL